jgi:hypothetical protein
VQGYQETLAAKVSYNSATVTVIPLLSLPWNLWMVYVNDLAVIISVFCATLQMKPWPPNC